MKKGYSREIVHSNIQVAENIFELKVEINLDDGNIEDIGKPGQFYMLRGWEGRDPFLSRPISIADISHNIVTFLYEVRGKGTHIISKISSGDSLELLGPLGNGFDLNISGRVGLISGGIGIAPLVYLSRELDNPIDFYCGFRNEVYYMDILRERVDHISISTEDGSQGHRGFITELFDPKKYDIVFTCGPVLMIEKVAEMCRGVVPVYASMESKMACGVGACLGCTIETVDGMMRVCKEGPVFPCEEVIFND
ncbi:MAG: dihydroorotate dehydrogenase electron transfer subunit [Tissierellaceae bacterium]